MKKIIWIIIAMVIIFIGGKNLIHDMGIGNQTEFHGLYEDEDGFLGLDFLDESSVDMLAKGEKLGDTVNYTMEGNTITIVHACGTWYLKIRGEKLYRKKDNTCFVKKDVD